MKKALIVLSLIVAIVAVAWALSALTLLVMRWAGVWSAARQAMVADSVPLAAVVLAVFVAEVLTILGALLYTVTKFPEAIGAVVDTYAAVRSRGPGRRGRRRERVH